MFLRSCRARNPLCEHARFRQQRFEQCGRVLEHDALIRQAFATAPSNESVLRVPSESSSFASRQSGLMAEKICCA